MSDIASVLGEAGERHVVATGWVGEHPTSGDGVAFMLLYPAGHGVAEKMRRLADMLGLRRSDVDPGSPPVEVPPDTTWATIDKADEGTSIWLHYGHEAWIHMPITDEWEGPARRQRFIVLSVGMDPLHTMRDLDRYVARSHRLLIGLVRLA